MAKVYSLTVRNKVGAVAFAAVIVGLGIVLLTVGFALLAGLAVAGGVLGAGFGIYNRLRGHKQALPDGDRRNQSGLDPALEVRPIEASVIRQIKNREIESPDES